MEWLRMSLAAIATTAVSFGALEFYQRRQKRREISDPDFTGHERRRAEAIVTSIGTIVVQCVQGAAGLTAGIAIFALLIFLSVGDELPSPDQALSFAAMFVIGCLVFSWCQRVTDALNEQKK